MANTADSEMKKKVRYRKRTRGKEDQSVHEKSECEDLLWSGERYVYCMNKDLYVGRQVRCVSVWTPECAQRQLIFHIPQPS